LTYNGKGYKLYLSEQANEETKFMIVFWIILSILLAIVGVLLVAPLELILNSERGYYRFAYRGLASGALFWSEPTQKWMLRVWILGWRKEWGFWDLITQPSAPKSAEKEVDRKKRKRKRRTPKHLVRRLYRVWRALEIRRCNIDIDTDDYILNAWLFPVFTVLGGRRGRMQINYEGRAAIDLQVIARPWKLLLAFALLR
jgi:hypothetical protein